ncbi:MAG: RagB/SusD family nutrient uptake outer membrane protein [Tannerella sp.]|jgi:hypothetical protein|nr:RagB/SusD family nutrient uptake outer membrane protein [Tannerella sp.]
MRINYNHKSAGIFAIGVLFLLSSCSDEFLQEKKDYNGFNDEIYNNFSMAQASVDYIHRQVEPKVGGVSALSGSTGSADDHSKSTLEYGGSTPFVGLSEILTSNVPCYFNGSNAPDNSNGVWINIRRCNLFLDNIEKGTLSEPEKDLLKGQVYFWRAWLYYRLVITYGGVPIIKEAQNPTLGDGTVEESTLNVPRNSTADCIAFICEDLDMAASKLPSIWSDPAINYGRVTRGAAMALKGRLLLCYASPLFNRSNDKAHWDAAYKANQAAYDELTKYGGRDLIDASTDKAKNWELMFSDVSSKEAVLVTLHNNQSNDQLRFNNNWEQSARPKEINGGGGIGSTAEMVDLFPMADGKKPSESSFIYDELKFYKDRDPRFYRTFAFNGVRWPYGANKNYTLWNYQWYKDNTTALSGKPGNSAQYLGDVGTGIFVRKRTNPNADNSSTLNSGVFSQSSSPYMEIRMAEVVLNVAESACGNGDDPTALTYLKKVRERLGYTGDCGLGSPAGDALMSAIIYERQIELAYEGKRFEDMRRWLLWDDSYGTCTRLNVEPISGNKTRRHGIILAVNPDVYVNGSAGAANDPFNPAATSNIGDRTTISLNPDASNADWNTQIAALDNFYDTNLIRVENDQVDGTGTPTFYITHLNKYYFLGIKQNVLQVSTKLDQNTGWTDYYGSEGTFNPLGTGTLFP